MRGIRRIVRIEQPFQDGDCYAGLVVGRQSLLEAQSEEDGRQDPLVGVWHAAAGSGTELGEGSTEADARPRVLRDRETGLFP
ncbi:hypothetical protein NDU88_002178 [Pleurodeles waltl]|uniref:Uncharacterized protein n=1 Tax=Pleurodeles waltl TaxID=8319 RepID=A0AAV7REQ6_PLEWA|nr:hypothetical protein NDU88_002178 [Pleurodeles waltl]